MNEPGPLSGLRVVSLAEQFPGPFATMILARLGAEIILVERPEGGDPSRTFPEFFAALNRNKSSVALDLKSARGRVVLHQLVATADVFLEGFRPGVASKLGADFPTLSQHHSSLAYVSIHGFSRLGSRAARPAHDLSYQAMSGILAEDDILREALAGSTDGYLSASSVFPIGDLVAGSFAAMAAMAALAIVRSSGEGFAFEVSMFDALLAFMTVPLSAERNGHPRYVPPDDPGYGFYRAGDGGWLTLSVAHEDRFWAALCLAIGRDDLSTLTQRERLEQEGRVRAQIAKTLGSKSLAFWAPVLDEAGVPWGALATAKDLANRESELYVGDDPGARSIVPLNDAGDPVQLRRSDGSSPRCGEHTVPLLVELGISDDEVADLIGQGVVPDPGEG